MSGVGGAPLSRVSGTSLPEPPSQGTSDENGQSHTNKIPSGLPCSSGPGEGTKAQWAGSHVEEVALPGFWLSLSPLTTPGLLNFFLAAKFHSWRGVRAVEGG